MSRTFLNRLIERFSLYNSPGLPKVGLYHFSYQKDEIKARLHLRVEPDRSSLLMINANRACFLNPTATLMAYYQLSEYSDNRALHALTQFYEVSQRQAENDLNNFKNQLSSLIDPNGPCPFHELDLETLAPFSQTPSAPYRMDLALTYRCNNNCAHCYNARERNYPELKTHDWFEILDILWEVGIPHIVFTGGEPTLRHDLPDLIAHAQKNGQITGVNTNGRRLKDQAYIKELVDAGLDHVQVTLESHNPQIHDRMVCAPGAWADTVAGIKNALQTRLFVMTNTTLLKENSPDLEQTLAFLSGLGVPTVGINALIHSGRGETVGTGIPEDELPPLLNQAQIHTLQHQQRLIWYTPTEYCQFDPVAFDLGAKGCSAARYNMCVEPDGSVIPCQSYYRQTLGNLRKTSWNKIWNHPLALSLRNRQNVPYKCLTCGILSECGGGCPLARESVQKEVLDEPQ
jgi:radical SAM protein with 4Fe4S-binding SPASM domain